MKAEQLRIGNWVSFYGDFSKVESIGTYGVSFNTGFAKYTLPNFKPIPLTEEILLKCGFERVDDKYNYFDHTEVAGLFTVYDKTISYSVDSNDICWIDYLHQLQNLFYSLCGKELEFNME